jgi:formiminoglutamase
MLDLTGFFTFDSWSEMNVQSLFFHRDGETRVGDVLMNSDLATAKYVIIGVEECCGPLANLGRAGAESAFPSFLRAFLNTQVHDQYPSSAIHILGKINEIKMEESGSSFHQVEALDAFLEQILSDHVKPHQVPIIIGGGHNNALPVMRWAARNKKLAVLNLDAHADLRSTEKRHSGNSFSTALQEGTLLHYSVLGLHEAYNNAFIRNALKNDAIFHSFYEDYLFENRLLLDDLSNILRHFHSDTHVGLEIDMDAIANMPSSALSPSGWSLDQVRQFVRHFQKSQNEVAYLNLTEAAPTTEQEMLLVGKSLSYLVRDFTKT